MIKRLISLCFFSFAIHAHADITVNTTADENGTNANACSLREAVALLNGDTAHSVGCTNSNTSTIIILQASTTYTVNASNGDIPIKAAMSIQSSSTGSINNTNGSDNPVVQMTGAHRIFTVQAPTTTTTTSGSTTTAPLSVTISDINLQGCGSGCETNGGIIYNHENLILKDMRLYSGNASNSGGAIYNANPGTINATNLDINTNAAPQGAAVYSENANVQITQSVIRANTATVNTAANPGYAVYTNPPSSSSTAASSITGGVTNSTIYNNQANAINIVPGISVNNATIVSNQGGVTLDAIPATSSATTAYSALANSIIGNNGTDCSFVSGDVTAINNVVYINGCDGGNSTYLIGYNRKLSNTGVETLMATNVSTASGGVSCALPPDVGLLCPFNTPSGQFNGYLLPRLLLIDPNSNQFLTLSDSPIVNQGLNVAGNGGTACPGVDQRNQTRTFCDIGAIELIIPSGNTQTNGEDIYYGQNATIDLTSVIGDGQLIPASFCSKLYGNPAAGTQWQDGCATFLSLPQLGTLSISAANANEVYTPSSYWHGFDKFTYQLTTTTSYFSQAQNNKFITLTTTIVQSPPTGIDNKTVGGGGSMGLWGLIALAGLAVRRRMTGGQPQ